MRKCLNRIIIVSLVIVLFSSPILVHADSYPQKHQIPEFWREEDSCWFEQKTNVSCVPACVQMILKSYSIDPLPSQDKLATEMKTDINHPTRWEFTYIPFADRGFNYFLNESLSDNKDLALHHLKSYTSKNYRIMVITWYSETDKEEGRMTHGRVITGYNETGVFFHDPLSGPNRFMHNSDFIELWDTDYGYWALVIKQDIPLEPHYILVKWIMDNLDIVALLIVGLVVEVHYVSRISNFTNSIALLLFFDRKGIPTGLVGILVAIYVIVGLISGIIGLISYISRESLPSEYYTFNFVLYNSLTVGLIMLISNIYL